MLITCQIIFLIIINIKCIVETVPNNLEPVMHSKPKPVWGLAQPDYIQKYQDELNELLYNFLPTNDMFMGSVNDSLCLKKEHITDFMTTVSLHPILPCKKHIPYSHKSKVR